MDPYPCIMKHETGGRLCDVVSCCLRMQAVENQGGLAGLCFMCIGIDRFKQMKSKPLMNNIHTHAVASNTAATA